VVHQQPAVRLSSSIGRLVIGTRASSAPDLRIFGSAINRFLAKKTITD